MNGAGTERRRRLPHWQFRRVEAWLEAYPEMLREIADRESLIVDGALAGAMEERTPTKGKLQTSDPTGVRGSKLADDWDLQKNRERVAAVRETLEGLDWARRTLVRVYYWEAHKRITWSEVGEAVHADERTCRRWRDAIVREIAGRLGL